MNWMKRHLIYINMVKASALMLMTCTMFLGSCTSESGTGTPDVTPVVPSKPTNNTETAVSQDEIKFQVSTASQMGTTRVVTIDNDAELSIQFIRVDAYFNGTTTSLFDNAQLRYRAYTTRWEFYSTSASNWTHYYWPIEGSVHSTAGTVGAVDFVGYVPYTPPSEITLNAYSTSNGPSFSAALPYTAGSPNTFDETNQNPLREFMYAYKTNQKNDYDGDTPKTGSDLGSVALQFQHPFALVNVYLKSAKRGTVINSVQLSGINTSGTFVYSSGWGSWGTSATLSKTVGKTVPNELNFNALIGGPYMVIPQTLSGSNNLTVNQTYNATTGDIHGTINDTWSPGYIYNYYLDLGKDEGRILVDVVIEPWQTHTVPTIDVK